MRTLPTRGRMRWRKWAAVAVTAALCAPALSDERTVKLYCARDVAGIPDSEMTLSLHGPHFVRVTFVGVRPSNGQTDRALRDCLQTAIKLDGSRDILATPWYRNVEPSHSNEPELLQPYGSLRQLIYRASSKTVALRKVTSAPLGARDP